MPIVTQNREAGGHRPVRIRPEVPGGKLNICLLCRDLRAHAASRLVRATCDLAEALAELGHSVHVLSDRSPGLPPDFRAASYEPLTVPLASGPFQGAEIETARHNLLHAAAVYRTVKRIHEQEQPVDVVLAPLWRSEGAVCLLDQRFPTVVSCMTSLRTLAEIDDTYNDLEDIDQRLALEREALCRSPYLHGLTDASLSKTISDYTLAPVATAVIGPGIRDRANTEVGRVDPELQAPDGHARRPSRVLFVGRIERRNGVDALLDALGQLLEDGIDASLTLAGPSEDPFFRFEAGAVERPRLADAVRLTGAVSDPELERLYAEADVVCVPSRYESHGIVVLEAMMFGKAIVTCDAGGINEVVDAGRDALVSPPEDSSALASSLRRLLTSQTLRTKLGAEARATFERRFEVGAVARRMESFLVDAIELHRSAEPSSGDVAGRLAGLLGGVLGLEPEAARRAAAELLDPAAGEPLRRLKAAARRTPQPSAARSNVRIGAVVLACNRAEMLARTLDSLDEQEMSVETIVIDDASTPANARRLSAVCAGRRHVRLRHSDVNLGTAAGRQLGIELTDTDLVLFLDDDAELLPGALRHLVAELEDHPSADAVSATVVSSDGLVMHSGGSIERGNDVVTFGLIGSDTMFDPEALPPSGQAGWVPGTAALVRRALLEEFPIDERMAADFEDNEWCYRVSLARPGSFRRSREALVFRQMMPSPPPDSSWTASVHRIELLSAAAHFYQRHGALVAPAVLDLLPEMRTADGTYDFGSARTLMELVAAKGPEWTAGAWTRGDLGALLCGHSQARRAKAQLQQLDRALAELADAQTERAELWSALAAQEATLEYFRMREAILCMIEQGGWWRLRGRVLPLIKAVGAVRRRSDGRDGSERSLLP